MRRVSLSLLSIATVALAASSVAAQDAAAKVAGGGISVSGWMGVVDKSGENANLTVNDAKFVTMGSGMHVTTGPAITYWNPANMASGNYTVKATFAEPKFQGLNNHPHPYGIVIGGNDLGTDNQTLLYCSAYGDGRFIARVMAPGAPRGAVYLNGRGEANAAIKKVNPGESVTQEIAVSVKGDKVECAINGTVVGSYDKAMVVGAGKLKSTDGMFGLRFGHNTEAHVAGFTMTKQ